MKNLLALMVMFLMVVNAKAVTPTKASTTPLTETQVKDEALAKELEKEVGAEGSAVKAKAPVATKAAPAASDELTLDDTNEAAVAKEIEAIEAQQSLTKVQNKKKSENNMYVAGSVGLLAYPSVGNTTGKYAGNFALGYIWDKSIMIEVGFGVAQVERDEWSATVLNQRDNYLINQYSGNIAAKYKFLFGKISPMVGAMIGQTQRQKTRRDPFNSGNFSQTKDIGTSQATDAGVIAGIDFEFNKDFAIGLDFKYMFNVSNAEPDTNLVGNPNYNKSNLELQAIEKLENYTAGVSARMNF